MSCAMPARAARLGIIVISLVLLLYCAGLGAAAGAAGASAAGAPAHAGAPDTVGDDDALDLEDLVDQEVYMDDDGFSFDEPDFGEDGASAPSDTESLALGLADTHLAIVRILTSTPPFLVGDTIAVRYIVRNTGKHGAADIDLIDDAFTEDLFEVESALTSFHWSGLDPGETVEHTVSVRLASPGTVSLASPRLLYRAEDASVADHTLETQGMQYPPVYILDKAMYNSMTQSHAKLWLGAAAGLLCVLLMPPFLQYRHLRSTNPRGIPAKRIKTKAL